MLPGFYISLTVSGVPVYQSGGCVKVKRSDQFPVSSINLGMAGGCCMRACSCKLQELQLPMVARAHRMNMDSSAVRYIGCEAIVLHGESRHQQAATRPGEREGGHCGIAAYAWMLWPAWCHIRIVLLFCNVQHATSDSMHFKSMHHIYRSIVPANPCMHMQDATRTQRISCESSAVHKQAT